MGALASSRIFAGVAEPSQPSASRLIARDGFKSTSASSACFSTFCSFSGSCTSEGVAADTIPATHSAITAAPVTAATTMRPLRLGAPSPSVGSPCSEPAASASSGGSANPSAFSSSRCSSFSYFSFSSFIIDTSFRPVLCPVCFAVRGVCPRRSAAPTPGSAWTDRAESHARPGVGAFVLTPLAASPRLPCRRTAWTSREPTPAGRSRRG